MSAGVKSIGLVASSDAPAAPYPADTKAKGWRFELDYERIEQSDTWVLATPDMRPWLLMLWMTAWRQVPCGSLPATDELIAARIGLDVRQFRAHRDILMRGWWLAADGRLYHPVITEQVASLVSLRDKEALRKQVYRDKKNQQVASSCPAGQSRDSLGNPVSATLPEPEPEPEEVIPSLPMVEKVAKGLPPSAPECPHAEIIKLWAHHCPTARQPAEWTPTRQTALRNRWRSKPSRSSLEWWSRFFAYVAESDFLMGRSSTPGRKPFELSLDWLLKEANFLKVIEGAYENREATA